MLGGYSQQIYVLIALITAAILTFTGTKKNRIVTFIITFWILGGSVIHLESYNLPLRMLGGGMQIKRFALIILTSYLFFSLFLKPRSQERIKSLPFEKYLYALVFWYLIIIGYHFFSGLFNTREFIGLSEGMMIVLVVYLIIKRTADSEVIKVIVRAIILVAVISSLVAIVQFFGNPWFLRIGGALPAFGGKLRSNGIFSTEYTHSYVSVAALIVTLVGIRVGRLKQLLVGLLLVGITLSFHRMSWLVTIFVLTGYLFLYKRESLKLITLLFPLTVSAVLFIALEIFPVVEYLEDSSLYNERLTANTWETRQALNEMVFRQLDRVILVGAGSTKSPLYYFTMMDAGIGEDWALGVRGGFHNLYIYYLFFYGLPFVLLFCILLISMLRYYFRLVIGKSFVFLIPLLFLAMFILMNLTNGFPLEADFGYYVGLFLGCSAAVACGSNLDVDDLIDNAPAS